MGEGMAEPNLGEIVKKKDRKREAAEIRNDAAREIQVYRMLQKAYIHGDNLAEIQDETLKFIVERAVKHPNRSDVYQQLELAIDRARLSCYLQLVENGAVHKRDERLYDKQIARLNGKMILNEMELATTDLNVINYDRREARDNHQQIPLRQCTAELKDVNELKKRFEAWKIDTDSYMKLCLKPKEINKFQEKYEEIMKRFERVLKSYSEFVAEVKQSKEHLNPKMGMFAQAGQPAAESKVQSQELENKGRPVEGRPDYLTTRRSRT